MRPIESKSKTQRCLGSWALQYKSRLVLAARRFLAINGSDAGHRHEDIRNADQLNDPED